MKSLLLNQYDLHHKLYNNVLAGFTDEETNQRLHGNSEVNHIKYLAGHLLNTQYGLGTIAGTNLNAKWDELFAGRGATKARDDIEYPGIEEIKAEWNRMHPSIRSGLNELSLETLSDTPSEPFDQFWKSIGEMWADLNHHQAYHIGQIGILRRGFGKAPMGYD